MSYYPTGYEHSSLGVPGTSCICDTCCGNNCRTCKSHPECGYNSFKIFDKEDEYWDSIDLNTKN